MPATPTPDLSAVRVCVFDAYGTLFDVASAARHHKQDLGERWEPLSDVWRTKQLQYTWLRSLMGRYVDFHRVTRDALDFALDSVGISDSSLADRLMALYERLDAYPEVPEVLRALKAAGKQVAILSNGSPGMLRSAVDAAGLGSLIDDQLSVDTLQVYKPHPDVYALATSRYGVAPADVAFFSSNGWDVAGAAAFGFRVVWINRFSQGRERLPAGPEVELADLRGIPGLFGL